MIKTTDIVRKLFKQSDTAQLAANEGILNISALAKQLKPEVDRLTKKTVTANTIRTALYRLLDDNHIATLRPNVKLKNMSIYPQVADITYQRSAELMQALPQAIEACANEDLFFTTTQGMEEVTIIAEKTILPKLTQILGKPDTLYEDLVAVSVGFSSDYLEVPNMIYSLLASLATQHINVMELVSTLTTITFVVYESELDQTLELLRTHLHT